jgi:uncharacterized protein (TIGR02594 family)
MVTRRMFIRTIGCLAAGYTTVANATDGNQNPSSLPSGVGVLDDYEGPLPPLGTLGKTPALKAEVKIAQSILAGAPTGTAPFTVARYFLDVGGGKLNPEWRPYVKGWPERWNPVIVTFFEATDTKPEGDLTSWCAAFLNWCVVRAGKEAATHSASSGSFRSFGSVTSHPIPGDIVVFKSGNPTLASEGRGHVGFFVADHGVDVEVLGGNQIEGHERSHMIDNKRIPKQSNALVLHSYRTEARLHPTS